MRQRSIGKMILLSIVTFGIYSLYWSVSTKNEMNKLGENVPTAWLLIIPFVNIYWVYKYSEAVEHVTANKVSTPLAFVVESFLGFIGDLVIQTEFNKLAAAPIAGMPSGPAQSYGTQPDNSFGGPVAAAPAQTPAPTAFPAPQAPVAPAAPFAPVQPQAAVYTPPAPEQQTVAPTVVAPGQPAPPQPPSQV